MVQPQWVAGDTGHQVRGRSRKAMNPLGSRVSRSYSWRSMVTAPGTGRGSSRRSMRNRPRRFPRRSSPAAPAAQRVPVPAPKVCRRFPSASRSSSTTKEPGCAWASDPSASAADRVERHGHDARPRPCSCSQSAAVNSASRRRRLREAWHGEQPESSRARARSRSARLSRSLAVPLRTVQIENFVPRHRPGVRA
jgi:hypothetical protein